MEIEGGTKFWLPPIVLDLRKPEPPPPIRSQPVGFLDWQEPTPLSSAPTPPSLSFETRRQPVDINVGTKTMPYSISDFNTVQTATPRQLLIPPPSKPSSSSDQVPDLQSTKTRPTFMRDMSRESVASIHSDDDLFGSDTGAGVFSVATVRPKRPTDSPFPEVQLLSVLPKAPDRLSSRFQLIDVPPAPPPTFEKNKNFPNPSQSFLLDVNTLTRKLSEVQQSNGAKEPPAPTANTERRFDEAVCTHLHNTLSASLLFSSSTQ